ncbi:glycerophosphoryl diester phosphodiesterase [Altererythrobacter atlanticus]|uniref:Cytoplasmic glycerophosphodiester phosphodiesterase n=1 Tax=Croceibacterium atlanticum TaxID=1267766 RepID=A0A0F7KWG3_9SPHN|nr:glycerophosphodiester phosphodiesterase family protein [Croceibacterium atlanticum]AKH43491.1 cytoplasmic glycerophosphodiester phosphodiesterase [Croceibacterium atlanticum]MBB5731801.1 glycerophosphoryl diester phosphodiesterase [Croceibacterium atlanticum]
MPWPLLDRWLAAAPEPARTDWLKDHHYAHRGLHGGDVVENSPGAFAAAIAAGMGVECDVQKSRDGRAIVFHDADLDRLTAEAGPLAARSVGELTRIALRGSGERIPTLHDLLAQTRGAVPLLIEIKSHRDRPVSSLCAAVRRNLEGYGGPYAVMSFDPRVVRWFARQAPAIPRGLVVTEQGRKGWRGRAGRHFALWQSCANFLACDIRDLPSRFAAAQRARGLPVLTWTVDSAELLDRAKNHADAPIVEGEGVA